MRVDVVTIFPEYLAPLGVSLIGKAVQRGLLEVRVHDLREWARDVHRTVDDTPYGGGPGMVMKPEPWGEALDAILADPPLGASAPGNTGFPGTPGNRDTPGAASDPNAGPGTGLGAGLDAHAEAGPSPAVQAGASTGPGPLVPTLVVPTPSGRPFTQAKAAELAERPWLIFACGRYEGIDRRVVEAAADRMPVEELSIGDYVLAGGEVAVLVVVEAVGRLLPGVLGNAESARDDSFAAGPMEGLLEGPVYTKPAVWRGRAVPEIVASGNHGAIARWRRDQALARTAAHRPELVARLAPESLDRADRAALEGLGWRVDGSRLVPVDRVEGPDYVRSTGPVEGPRSVEAAEPA